MAHRSGESRQQTTLFPVMLDELVDDDAVVRVIDAWVGSLDLKALGFDRTQTAATGRPPYDPGDLLKLYVYGYLNGVRSSRRLERECLRNVEVMWMLGRLAPDHKTIANFRRSESAALVESAAAFVQFARAKGLVAGETVAIDGTKLRAVALRKAIVGQRDLAAQAEALRQRIRGYLSELDEIDSQEAPTPTRRQAVQEVLKQLKEEQAGVEQQAQTLRDCGKQHSRRQRANGKSDEELAWRSRLQPADGCGHGQPPDRPPRCCQRYVGSRSARTGGQGGGTSVGEPGAERHR